MQGGEDAEGLRDAQRGVVGQHDAAGADAQILGSRREVADENFRRGRNDAGQVVVFADPVSVEPEAVDVAGKVHGVAQRLSAR